MDAMDVFYRKSDQLWRAQLRWIDLDRDEACIFVVPWKREVVCSLKSVMIRVRLVCTQSEIAEKLQGFVKPK